MTLLNWKGMIFGALVGGLLAWAFHCPGNTCAITSRWYVLVAIGAVMGFLWSPTPPKTNDRSANTGPDQAGAPD